MEIGEEGEKEQEEKKKDEEEDEEEEEEEKEEEEEERACEWERSKRIVLFYAVMARNQLNK